MALRLHAFLTGTPLTDALDEAIRRYVGADLLIDGARLAERARATRAAKHSTGRAEPVQSRAKAKRAS